MLNIVCDLSAQWSGELRAKCILLKLCDLPAQSGNMRHGKREPLFAFKLSLQVQLNFAPTAIMCIAHF